MDRLRVWIGNHRLEIAVTGMFILLVIPWLIPPVHFSTFRWQMWMRIPLAVSGVFGLPFFVCLLPLWYARTLPILLRIIGIGWSILLIGLLGWECGTFIRRVKEHPFRGSHLWTGIIAALIIGLNLPCSLCTLVLAAPLQRSESCTAYFSKTGGIKVVTYTAIAWRDVPIRATFFLATQDSGQSWQQKIYRSEGDWTDEICRHVTTQRDTLIWTWGYKTLYFSADGGKTWRVNKVPLSQFEYIKHIDFEDSQHAQVTYGLRSGGTRTLFSTDGGKSWQMSDAMPQNHLIDGHTAQRLTRVIASKRHVV